MKWNFKIIGLCFGGILCFFSVYEYKKQIQNTGFFVQEDIVFLKTESADIFSVGNFKSPQAQMLLNDLHSFFAPDLIPLESQPSDQIVQSGHEMIIRFSENIFLIHSGSQKIWIVKKPTEQEKKALIKEKISLSGDILFLEKNQDIDWFASVPDKIVFFGSTHPSSKLKKLAQDQKKSLISAKQVGGVSLFWNKENWDFKTGDIAKGLSSNQN